MSDCADVADKQFFGDLFIYVIKLYLTDQYIWPEGQIEFSLLWCMICKAIGKQSRVVRKQYNWDSRNAAALFTSERDLWEWTCWNRDFHSPRRYSSFQLLQQCTKVAKWKEPCGAGNAKDIPEQPTGTKAFPFALSKDTYQFQHLPFTMPEQHKGPIWNPTDHSPERAVISWSRFFFFFNKDYN